MKRVPASFSRLTTAVGRALAGYLNTPIRGYHVFGDTAPAALLRILRPADVLLVEGNLRISTAIKFLTQSTWSHAGLFIGRYANAPLEPETPLILEAEMEHGVRLVPLTAFAGLNLRVCRPTWLSEADQARVCRFALARIGNSYDLKNLIDLCRYLLPTPPVPSRWRRRMLALGSGDPTRAICSGLIAQAFQSVRYPILPRIEAGIGDRSSTEPSGPIFHLRHHSLFMPRDFDVSPYFSVIKPGDSASFDYSDLTWGSGS